MRFVVLEGNGFGKTTTKLVSAATFDEEGGNPMDFFVAGITEEAVLVGEVDITIAVDHSGRMDYPGHFPEMWVND